jgi:hypothetical protein
LVLRGLCEPLHLRGGVALVGPGDVVEGGDVGHPVEVEAEEEG